MANQASEENLSKKVAGKLGLLKFIEDETRGILNTKDFKAIERQLKIYESKIEEVYELKTNVQELKLENDDEPGEIRNWSNKIEGEIKKFDHIMAEMRESLKQIKLSERREEEQELLSSKQRQFEVESELEKARYEQKFQYERRLEELKSTSPSNEQESTKVKLPKLIISKFQGTHLDWYRFWNQFEAEIDRVKIDSVTKFSYLKELLMPKVRAYIEGLPFTTEGYERAKQILKSTYGKSSEIINAYVQNVTALPVIKGGNPAKIHEFYGKLVISVQALESMGKLGEINGLTRATLDKLEGIRADLVRTDDSWQEWGFPQLVNALRRWTERNPISQEERGLSTNFREANQGTQKREKFFQVRQEWKRRPCIYCEGDDHKSVECKKVTEITQRRECLKKKKLCFNCTGTNHRAAECRVRSGCQVCSARHHTSICDKKPEQVLLATGEQGVIYPIVIVSVNGVKCRALLDTGAGSSYISDKLVNILGKRPVLKQNRQIDMMLSTVNRQIEIYNVEVQNLKGDFKLEIDVSKVDREVLLSVKNPRYQDVLKKYPHLQGVTMDDVDQKSELPVHVILGASEYAKIKTDAKAKIGKPGEPVGEHTRLGWTLISSGADADAGHMFFAKGTLADYERLCNLDVLGLENHQEGEEDSVYSEFREQLKQQPQGYYETGLLWKANCPPLQDNKAGSLARLDKLAQKLQREPELFTQYDQIIKDQEAQGIIERAEHEPGGRSFYLPHKPVVRQAAESTKVRVVYDASAKPNNNAPSLNECLETGPPLQNLIWDVLARNRVRPISLAGDLKQAFLQIRIKEEDRDVLRFHWIKGRDRENVETFRFTRALFGLNQSPFLLGATIEEHMRSQEAQFPAEVEEIRHCIYVDDILLSGETQINMEELKDKVVKIFDVAGFKLHKWHSNLPGLEQDVIQQTDSEISEQSFAKQQLGVGRDETKLLGLFWNKDADTLGVVFPENQRENVTKRSLLKNLASVYDPLGIVSPVTLGGKLIYRDVCDAKLPWDQELSTELSDKWNKWTKALPDKVEIPRSISEIRESIDSIDLHAFGDSSGFGTAACVYAVITQPSRVSQGLLAAKSRLAKKGLTIPRLELVSGHMAANLLANIRSSLTGLPVRSCYGWLDSSVALHWIKGQGNYKQFVSNRVRQIQEKNFIEWRHVGTVDNPADIGSRGCPGNRIPTRWFRGPEWLSDAENWPLNIETKSTEESEVEAKPIKEIFKASVEMRDQFDEILEKYTYWNTMRLMAWMNRFATNCRAKKADRIKGPLTTEEIQSQIMWWIKRVQARSESKERFKNEQQRLNLQKNNQGIYKCMGRIQGSYPIYLPSDSLFSEKIVADAHVIATLHGGVSLTMAYVRQTYWIPRLRKMVKRIRSNCHGCKRFHTKAYSQPSAGMLPKDRTEGSRPFEVIGVDFAGPLAYKVRANTEGKAYILLFACSLTRAVYINIVTDMTIDQFMVCLKEFIARRGRPNKIYTDNAKTFVAASKKIRKIMESEKIHNYLARNNIKWQFNLSKAPWWGGQFERIIGLVKQAMFKVLGRANLSLQELKEIMLDVEIALNNRPLCYVEDDIQLPELTPNIMLLGHHNSLINEEAHDLQNKDMRKRAKYLEKCKQNLWKRWTNEYVRALRERHNLTNRGKEKTVSERDVVLIHAEDKNRGKWSIGIVECLIKGRDGVVRAARVKTRKTVVERAVQLLYPLELACERERAVQTRELNPQAEEYRPKRKAAQLAAGTVREIIQDESRDLADD